MRHALVALIPLLVVPAISHAEMELSLTLGYRGGDASFPAEANAPAIACLVPPCVVADAHTPEGEVLGLILDLPVDSNWMLEVLLSRQDADLDLVTELPPEALPLEPESFELTVLQLGALRRWRMGAREPFVVAAIGVARSETSARVLEPPVRVGEVGRRVGAQDGLSWSVGGGVRLALEKRWGLRLEFRAYRHDLPSELGGELIQAEVSAGLSARL
jgi:hypothetical protein